MGCNSSLPLVSDSDNIVVSKSECLAGKFKRSELPKKMWMSRMKEFIAEHISQFKTYTAYDILVMYRKLHTYENNGHIYDKTNKHLQAIRIVSNMLRADLEPSAKRIKEELTSMATFYCNENREHEFEEIMFVFSIIVNAPMIQFYEIQF